jgi:hypothetical protein
MQKIHQSTFREDFSGKKFFGTAKLNKRMEKMRLK